jgi:branched-chain amino acid transport system substrate-binding protein
VKTPTTTLWLGLALAGALLSACGSSAASSGAASGSSPASAAAGAGDGPSAAASKPAASKPTASAAGSGSAAANAPIKIGLVVPLTGVSAPLGKDNQDGFNLYMDSINSTVAGRKIEIVTADETSQPDTALTKAKALVENDKVNLLMGVNSTASCYAIAPYVKQAQVPFMVSMNCGAETLMTDPKYATPYMVRFTQNGSLINDPAADWAYSNGKRKAVIMASDYGGGLENSDLFASAFIKRGGSIIQELYPPLGNNDFGPYLSKLDRNADVFMVFLLGSDALKFGEQYNDYVGGGANKPTLLELFAGISSGAHIQSLKDKVVGFVGATTYSTAIDSPENKAFLKAYQTKFPNGVVSTNVAQGYSMAQVLEAAVKKVDGKVEDKQQLMDALYTTTAKTAKGPAGLDKDHDVVENMYIYETVKAGTGYDQKLLKTYEGMTRTWDRTQQQIDAIKIGTNKGKWVGVTAEQVRQMESRG